METSSGIFFNDHALLGHGLHRNGRGPFGLQPNNEEYEPFRPFGIWKKLLERLIQQQKLSGCQSTETDPMPTRTDEQPTTTSVTTSLDGSTVAANTGSPPDASTEPTLSESASDVGNVSNATNSLSAVTAEAVETEETAAESTQSTAGELASDGSSDSSTDNVASSSDASTVV